MALYDRLIATTTRLLTQYGAPMTLSSDTRAAAAFKAVRSKDIKHEMGGTFMSAGVQLGDVEFLVEGAANPLRGENFTFASKGYVVIVAEPIAPGGTAIAWTVVGRPG